jgi:hypothetical protein
MGPIDYPEPWVRNYHCSLRNNPEECSSPLLPITWGNLSLSYNNLFPASKQYLGGNKFKDNRDVETVVTRWLKTWETELYGYGTEMLVPLHDKCLHFWRRPYEKSVG